MDDDITPINKITSSTRDWTAKVRVIEKWNPRVAKGSSVRYQKLILADVEVNFVSRKTYLSNAFISQIKNLAICYEIKHDIYMCFQGTRVMATIFANQINLFEHNLKLFQTYYISNAGVNFVEKKYRLGPHPWQWTIHGSTLIQEVENAAKNPNLLVYNFIPLQSIHNL